MIFALRQPAVLLGLVLGFLVGCALLAVTLRWLAEAGWRRRRLSSVGGRRTRTRRGWAGYLDPYGIVAAVLAGAGWGPRPETRRATSFDWLAVAAALVVHGGLMALGLAAYAAAGGPLAGLDGVPVSSVLHGTIAAGSFGRDVALGFALVNLACGVLALVPIPPMPLGVALWSRLPRSAGARRLAYHLLDEQWGVAALLLLLLIPLFGSVSPLLAAVDAVGDAVFARF